MQLAAYVQFAIRLANTAGDRSRANRPPDERDRLTSLADLRAMLTNQPTWRRMATDADVPVLRELRSELRTVFEDASVGEESAAVQRLNALLAGVRASPRITGHDGQDWHLHLAENARTTAEGYTAAAVLGLAFCVADQGLDRLGICRSAPCRNVFVDTSSNRSRRYCSDRCATRANVAAHRARRREADALVDASR